MSFDTLLEKKVIKCRVCLGACHGKMLYIHQITCFLGRVTEKCHIYIYIKLHVFRGVSRKMSFNAIWIKLHVCFGACHGKMSLNSMNTSIDVYMEVNDISPDTPLKSCHLTCTCYLVAFSGDAPRQIYLWTCTWNLMTFPPDAHLKTSFDVYMEFNDIFT